MLAEESADASIDSLERDAASLQCVAPATLETSNRKAGMSNLNVIFVACAARVSFFHSPHSLMQSTNVLFIRLLRKSLAGHTFQLPASHFRSMLNIAATETYFFRQAAEVAVLPLRSLYHGQEELWLSVANHPAR